jgi:hypothetical protein
MGWNGQGPNYAPFTVHYLNCKETGNQNQLCRVIDRRRSFNGVTVLVLQQEDVSLYDDTIPLNDPLQNNEIPLRIDRIGTLTPRLIDRVYYTQYSPYVDDPFFDFTSPGSSDERFWNFSSGASVLSAGGEGGSNALQLDCIGAAAFVFQVRQFSLEGETLVVTIRYKLSASGETPDTDHEVFVAATPFRSDPGGGKTPSPSASEVFVDKNYSADLDSSGDWATEVYTLDLSTELANGEFNLVRLRIGGSTNGNLSKSHTTLINSVGVKFT